jgi:apolipoprotein D and lipocalin family protein
MKISRTLSALLLSGLLFLGGSPAIAKSKPPLQTQAKVDMNRFLGLWYEIAYTPNPFEKHCVGNTTDEYFQLSPRLLKVINRCDTKGKPFMAEGRSKILDDSGAKQRTTFLKLLGWIYLPFGDFWITALDKDYQYFIVAQPSRRYGWIMGRTPSLPTETLQHLAQKLKEQGYDPCQFVTTPHSKGLDKSQSLCTVTGITPSH